MRQTGLTRKIDDLGRIVIPKEIRKNLKIRNNDELLINISDERIVLSKYLPFNKDDVLKCLVDTARKVLKKDVLITSKDKVIVSSNSKYNDLLLSNSTINKIEKRDIFYSFEVDKVNLFINREDISYIVCPLIVNSVIYGSIMVISNDIMDDFSLQICEFIRLFLENYLDE